MFNQLKTILKRPELYEETAVAFWEDKHISAQMLKAHLDPDFEGASRKLAFIEESVAWIVKTMYPQAYPRLLDLGCGPGIYAERFAKSGFEVTGVDFSQRSIDYAQNSACNNSLSIEYICQNYLALNLGRPIDFAVMIYCDYGALSVANRRKMMQNIYRHLKPGGKFLLDVFTLACYDAFQEKQTWAVHSSGGFWREGEHIVLNGCCKYTENVTLEQIAVIDDREIARYYLWTSYFTRESLLEEARQVGFKVCDVFGDVAGRPYHSKSLTLAALLEK